MTSRVIRLFVFTAVFAVARMAVAQEGHPLTGTWYGDWGTSTTQRTQITIVMSWDGKNITGLIDPGPNSAPIKTATLDSKAWMVHIEADMKDKSGAPVHVVADGKLTDIGSYNRVLSGTWMYGSTKADFKVKRD